MLSGSGKYSNLEDITLREKYKHSEFMFDNAMHIKAQFKNMSKILTNINNYSRLAFEQSKQLSELLQSFSFTSNSTEPDPLITICGIQYLKISQIQLSMANQLNDILISPLKTLMKEELNEEELKENHRTVNQKRDAYSSLYKSIEKEKKKSKTNLKTQQELQTSKQEFESSVLDFQTKLRDASATCRFDFLQRLTAYLFSNKSCFQQGMTVFDQIGQDLLAIMKDMEDAKSEYMLNKNKDDHRISLFVSQTQESGLEKQGYLYKLSNKKVSKSLKNWNMRWFHLGDGLLSWFSKWKNTTANGHLQLKLCSIKASEKPLTFEITQAKPEVRFILRGLTEFDYNEWFNTIKNAISYALSKDDDILDVPKNKNETFDLTYYGDNENILSTLVNEDESNSRCADCGKPDPDWVSINLGSIICIHCSGIHRSLGSHVSKVRSLNMDSLRSDVKVFLLNMGNNFVNEIFEANTKSESSKSGIKKFEKPSENSTEAEKTKYIKRKYIKKRLMNIKNLKQYTKEQVLEIINNEILDISDNTKSDEIFSRINGYLSSASRTRNVIRKTAFLYFNGLFSTLDNDLLMETDKTLFHELAIRGESILTSFFILNGHPFDKSDCEGRIPLHYAALSESLECCQLLSNKNNIKATDKNNDTPIDLVKESSSISAIQILEFFTSNDLPISTNAPVEKLKVKRNLNKSWTLTGRSKSSKPNVVGVFSKRGSEKRPPKESIEISRPITFSGTEQAKTLRIKSRSSISGVDILMTNNSIESPKKTRHFKRKSLSVPGSPVPVRSTDQKKPESTSKIHIRQESLDTLDSNDFWKKVNAKLDITDEGKTRLKRSLTVTSESKLKALIPTTSKDDHTIFTKSRIPSWSKDFTQQMFSLDSKSEFNDKIEDDVSDLKSNEPAPSRPLPISEEDKGRLKLLKPSLSSNSIAPQIPPKKKKT